MPFTDPERYRSYQRTYQRTWPWRKAAEAAGRARRRAVQYGLDPGTLTKEIFARLHLLPCVYCGGMPAMGVDHALALGMGGANALENLVPAHLPCNQRKTGEK